VTEEIDGIFKETEVLEEDEQADVQTDGHQETGFAQFPVPRFPCFFDAERTEEVHKRCKEEDQYVLRNEGHIEIAACGQQEVPPEPVRKCEKSENNNGEENQKLNRIKKHKNLPFFGLNLGHYTMYNSEMQDFFSNNTKK
jgi:hypothetical protein